MFLALSLVSALAAAPSVQRAPATDLALTEIRRAVVARHPSAHVEAIIIHGNYAIANARSASGVVIDGLHLTRDAWKIACTFQSPPTASEVKNQCGFPAAVASEIAANESAQFAVQKGDFSSAATAEKRAYASASGPERDRERARAQYLTILSERMRTGLITRAQGIQAWSAFRYSWTLP